MKLLLILFAAFLGSSQLPAQDVTASMRELAKQGKCREVIEKYSYESDTLPASALFIIAACYDEIHNYDKAAEFLDLAMKKGPIEPDFYYLKAQLFHQRGRYKETIDNLKKITELPSSDTLDMMGDVYANLGGMYYELKEVETAEEYFLKAIEYDSCPPMAFAALATIKQDNDEIEDAIKYWKIALEKEDPKSMYYEQRFSNYAYLLQQAERYTEALEIFIRLDNQYSNQLYFTDEIIQCYYGLGEYDKAIPYKEKFYAAKKKKNRAMDNEDSFTIDVIPWKDKSVVGIEMFIDSSHSYYAKYRFFVADGRSEPKVYVDLETSDEIRAMGKGVMYMLFLNTPGSSKAFPQFLFPEKFDYREMKAAVMQILEENVKPKEEEED
ncbi:MAG: tetratricopeptide repeat protein [Chloroflexota bacterium]